MFSEFEISLIGKQKQRLQAVTWFFFFFKTGPVAFWLPFLFFFEQLRKALGIGEGGF